MNTLEILEKLVAFPTVSSDSNLELVEFARSHLESCGFDCRLVPDRTGQKANLFASIGPQSDDGIVLSGHTDVVPAAGQAWTTDPFRLVRGKARVFGRGATDMKGFLASVLVAAKAVGQGRLSRPLHIAFSHDEEIGCVGVRSLLDDLAARNFKAAFCIVGEPTSMRIVTGHKGKLAARATCSGVAGHSAEAPNFLNAIHLACDFVSLVRDGQSRIAAEGVRDNGYGVPYTTLHVGRIEGGRALNVVASQATVDFEIRHLAGDDAGVIIETLKERAVASTTPLRTRFPTAEITIDVLNAYPGLAIEETSPVVEFARSMLPQVELGKVSFGTEAGLFVEKLGLPTVIIGPGSMDQGHQPDEFIMLDQLHRCDAMMARLVAQLR